MPLEDLTPKPVDPGYSHPPPLGTNNPDFPGGPTQLPADQPPEWLSKPGPDRPRVGGDSQRAQWAFDPKTKKLVKLEKQKALLNMKINLGSPLIVRTKTGEVLAGPGDIIGDWGRHQVMMSKDMFIALIGQGEYDELLKKEMLKVIIAKRLDDGQPAYTEEELGGKRAEIDKVLEAKARSEEEIDPNDLNQRIQIVHSSEGPPTALPDEYGTIVPGPMLPIPVNMPEEPGNGGPPPPTGIDASGATAGSPGTWSPSGADAPPSFAAAGTLTADPTTPWTAGQYVTCGDGAECYWNGTAWVEGRAPIV